MRFLKECLPTPLYLIFTDLIQHLPRSVRCDYCPSFFQSSGTFLWLRTPLLSLFPLFASPPPFCCDSVDSFPHFLPSSILVRLTPVHFPKLCAQSVCLVSVLPWRQHGETPLLSPSERKNRGGFFTDPRSCCRIYPFRTFWPLSMTNKSPWVLIAMSFYKQGSLRSGRHVSRCKGQVWAVSPLALVHLFFKLVWSAHISPARCVFFE